MKFRKMKHSDVISLFLIDQRYFADSKSFHSFMVDFLYDDRISFVCIVSGNIVASIIAEESKNMFKITSICVKREFSNHGIAKKLLTLCLTEIKTISLFKNYVVQLMVSVENIKAISIYKKFGFEITEMEKGVYIDGTDGFIMYLKGKCKV